MLRGEWRLKRAARASTRRVLGLALVVAAGIGCHAELPRLVARGKFAEVERRATKGRARPRKKAARAWAVALVELEQLDEARAVLLRDFRRGGQVASLVQLAELESDLGLEGIAAAHYARALALERNALQGRSRACEAFRKRARALLTLDEPMAADRDLRRIEVACAEVDLSPTEIAADIALMGRVRTRAEQRVRSLRSLEHLGQAVDLPTARRSELEASLEAQIDAARSGGPRVLYDFARGEGIQLPVPDLLGLLAAELSGDLPILIGTGDLRGLAGEHSEVSLEAATARLPDGMREYVQLRLDEIRVDPDSSAQRRAEWASEAVRQLETDPRTRDWTWRVLLTVGELNGAELALRNTLRRRADEASTAPDASEPQGSEAAAPVSSAELHKVPLVDRVPMTRRTMGEFLALARLLDARGKSVDALELRVATLRRARGQGVAGMEAVAVGVARRALVRGRPWEALAIADALGTDGSSARVVAPAVASALVLHMGGGDSERALADRVMGSDWAQTVEVRLSQARRQRDFPGPPTGPCRSSPELLGHDADGSMARILRRARGKLEDPEVAQALERATESELTLACRAPVTVTLLDAGGHQLVLRALDDRLTYAHDIDGALPAESASLVALAAGRVQRSLMLLIQAAAESPDPKSLWARAARRGHQFGSFEYEQVALRQVLMHSPQYDDPNTRRALLLSRLREAGVDPNWGDDSQAGATVREAARRAVERHLAEIPGPRRWHERERLATELGSVADSDTGDLIEDAMFGADTGLRSLHPRGARETASNYDWSAIALARAGTDELVGLQLKRGNEDSNAAAAVAVTGAPAQRALALQSMLARADPKARAQIIEVLASGLAGLTSQGETVAPQAMLDDSEILFRLAFGLDLIGARLTG